MYRQEDKLYIVMEFKKGTQIEEVWDSIPEPAKSDVVAHLRVIMDDLRRILSPGIFGSVSHGPVPHKFFWTPVPYPQVNGPFEHEQDFSMAMAKRSQCAWEEEMSSTDGIWVSGWLARNLPTGLKGHPSVFTHGDFRRKNIPVENVAANDGIEGPQWRVTALLDWEDGGWYPSYWEYASSFMDFGMGEDWPEQLDSILEPFPLEAGLLKVVRQDLDY
jgi:aminoglycoside phosphotransferase (APT) family kinase protein